MKIGFIGTGNMNSALIKGYSQEALNVGNELFAYNRTRVKAQRLAQEVSLKICDSIKSLVEETEIIVLGVEPQNYDEVMPLIASSYTKDKIFVSIAAGITIEYIEKHLGEEAKVVRVMPNTPAMVGLGASALCRNSNVTDDEFDTVRKIFISVGLAEEVDEEMIHAVIGVSGSAPAYTYMYIDALTAVGIRNGLDYDSAKLFAAQGVIGAARLVIDSEESPDVLCDRVCSPGGTTIEAVTALKENKFQDKVIEGAEKAIMRSKEITK